MILIFNLLNASDNLTCHDFWKKDISNNLYFTSGKIGIGITRPNYDCVLNNINCNEIYIYIELL